jgi:hypothetical protein
MNKPDQFEEGAASMTIREFCEAERMSPASYHRLQRGGKGPKTIELSTGFIRIIESRESWHRRMTALAETRKAQREHERRRKQTAAAGKVGWAKGAHKAKPRKRVSDAV